MIFHFFKVTRNLFRLKKENEAIKNLFEHEEEDFHKPVRVSNSWSSNYIHLHKFRPYLKDII